MLFEFIYKNRERSSSLGDKICCVRFRYVICCSRKIVVVRGVYYNNVLCIRLWRIGQREPAAYS